MSLPSKVDIRLGVGHEEATSLANGEEAQEVHTWTNTSTKSYYRYSIGVIIPYHKSFGIQHVFLYRKDLS